MRARPLVLTDGEPRLAAARCQACDELSFPARARCPRCGADGLSVELLPAHGELWTWTSQGFEPKSPPYRSDGDFAPFLVGYVEFAGRLRVEGRLLADDPSSVRIGAKMRVVPYDHLGVPSYAFASAEDSTA